MVLEQNFWWGKFACGFDLTQHVIGPDVHIMKHSLGLKTQSQQSVGLRLSQLVLLNVFCGVGALQVLHFLFTQQILGRHFEQVDIWSY